MPLLHRGWQVVKLLVQPDDGIKALIDAISDAKKSIEIMIFRFDHKEVERALMDAMKRGVAVQALIAFTNRGGERRLRDLEMRLLGAGAVVARTNNDLARYHGKYMIIDGRDLYILAFNFTKSDVDRSRSFGLVTNDAKLVQDASKLFAADCARQPCELKSDCLVVSPINSRDRLADFLRSAKKELLIYDLEVSDVEMVHILKERAQVGVKTRIIGFAEVRGPEISVRFSHPLRLHARVIVRDGEAVFIGSQSLRRLELDLRREVGVIVNDSKIASRIAKTFDTDWESAKEVEVPAEKVAKKIAKAIAGEIPPISAVLDQVVAKNGKKIDLDREHLEEAVRDAVKTAVHDAVQEVVADDTTVSR